MARILEQERHAAERWLRDTVAARLGDQPFASRIVDAPPVAAIQRAARDTGADLVVVGTHGRTGWNRLLLGSVAERLLRESARPVLTVRQPEAGVLWPAGPRRIVCPVNFRDVSLRALAWARTVAARFDAELLVLHAVEDGDAGDNGARLEQLCGAQATHCSVRPQVRHGEASTQVLDVAAREGADLIVLGAEHRPLMEGAIIGTTSVRVVRHASIPVLTVTTGPSV